MDWYWALVILGVMASIAVAAAMLIADDVSDWLAKKDAKRMLKSIQEAQSELIDATNIDGANDRIEGLKNEVSFLQSERDALRKELLLMQERERQLIMGHSVCEERIDAENNRLSQRLTDTEAILADYWAVLKPYVDRNLRQGGPSVPVVGPYLRTKEYFIKTGEQLRDLRGLVEQALDESDFEPRIKDEDRWQHLVETGEEL